MLCPPVYGNGHQSEDRGGHRDVGHEVIDRAVESTKGPMRVEHEDEVEDAV